MLRGVYSHCFDFLAENADRVVSFCIRLFLFSNSCFAVSVVIFVYMSEGRVVAELDSVHLM